MITHRFDGLAALVALAGLLASACTELPALPPAPHPMPPTDAAPVDPPLRALLAIPHAEARTPFADEEALFAAIRDVYGDNGFPEAREVELTAKDRLLFPSASRTAVATRHFLGDGPWARDHLGEISKQLYGGRLEPYFRQFDDDRQAAEAYQAFMATALAHELAHTLAMARGLSGGDAWLEEMRAIRFERAVLVELVRLGKVPASWPDLTKHFHIVLLAAAPPGLVAELPADAAARSGVFNPAQANLLAALAGKEGATLGGRDSDVALALASHYRIELAKEPPEQLRDLAPLMTAPVDATPVATALVRWLAHAEAPGLKLARVPGKTALTVEHADGNWTTTFVASERGELDAGVVRVISELDGKAAGAQKGRVAELLAKLNAGESYMTFALGAGNTVELRSYALAGADGYPLAFDALMRRHFTLMAREQVNILAAMGIKRAKR